MGLLTSCTVTATVAMLFVATLGGIYAQGRTRVFLGGFAIGGWGFLVLAYGMFNLDNFGAKMLTTDALKSIERAWLGEPPSYGSTTSQDPFEDVRWQLDFIGNCVFTLTCGLLCGLVALRFAQRAPNHEHSADQQFNASPAPTRSRELATAYSERDG